MTAAQIGVYSPPERLSVLLVEDNAADARLVRDMLKGVRPSLAVTHVTRLDHALEHLHTQGFSAVLLDLTLPDSEGMDTFIRARDQAPQTPIVVLTGMTDEDLAAKAVREGAEDYLIKGQVDGPLLYQSIRYAVERRASDEALRKSEERYRQLAESINEAILIVDLATSTLLYLSQM